MNNINKKIQDSKDDYNKLRTEGYNIDSSLKVAGNVKSEYSMFGLIFNHIASLRIRTTDAGILVRMNNSQSPIYLEAYHVFIYAFLEQVSVVIPDSTWQKISAMWKQCGKEIEAYQKQRIHITNKKIPTELIQKLDNLSRVALLAAQRGNLGINIVADVDLNKAIEEAVVGN